ncbi:HORMA domain [Orobanche gracilis]
MRAKEALSLIQNLLRIAIFNGHSFGLYDASKMQFVKSIQFCGEGDEDYARCPQQMRLSSDCQMITEIARFIRTLEKMPEERTILMKLLYYDDLTAPNYESPFFSGWTEGEVSQGDPFAVTYIRVEDKEELLWVKEWNCRRDILDLIDALSNFPDISVETADKLLKEGQLSKTRKGTYEIHNAKKSVYEFTIVKEEVDGPINQVFGRAFQVEDLLHIKVKNTVDMDIIKASSSKKAMKYRTKMWERAYRQEKPKVERLIFKVSVLNRKALLIGMAYPTEKNHRSRLGYSLMEVNKMKKILMDSYGFTPPEILMMYDNSPNFLKPTYDNITTKVLEMVEYSRARNNLFLYVTGHGAKHGGRASIQTSDSEYISDKFLSTICKKVHPTATLTAIVNTCYSGSFFQDATKVDKKRGEVIALTSCSWNQISRDGEFFREALQPLLPKEDSVFNVYQDIRTIMETLNGTVPQLYCTDKGCRINLPQKYRSSM